MRIFNIPCSKKGSAMVEAAIVMPVVIFAVVGTVCLLVLFYSQVSIRSAVHMALRQTAGIATNTVMEAGDTDLTGLYDGYLKQKEWEEMLQEQVYRQTRGMPAVGGMLELQGEAQILPLPVLRLHFRKQYRGCEPFLRALRPENSAVYYNIDEAQWIRNEDWIRERKENDK